MSDDAPTDARRPYNRPRRYPATPPAAGPAGPDTSAEVTRQNPTLAEAAQDYERRYGYPGSAQHAPVHPPASVPDGAVDPPRTLSRRTLLIGAVVLVVIAVVGLVLGLSGGDDSTPTAAPASSARSSSAPPTPSTPAAAPGSASTATQVCSRLAATAPFTNLVARPRPAARMPDTYVEPQAGVRIGICVATFLPGAGPGRGRLAYLAEYEQLAATQYAATLKTLGWEADTTLPRTTYRNPLNTTVTLVQRGTSLVTVVGTGR